jgi:CBS domain-containing protein
MAYHRHSMSTGTPDTGRISLAEAAELTVADVMIKRPKSLAGDATLADVRRAFENPSVRTVLLADGGRFVGAIERDRVPADAADGALARAFIDPEPLTVEPALPVADAVALLEGRSEPRLIVLEAGGETLLGLLCASGDITGFCVR